MQISVDNDNITITINKEEVTGTYIGVGKEYSYAELSAKIKDNEYVRVNYEWNKSKDVPDFVLALMEFIRKNKESAGATVKGAWSGKEDSFKESIKASLDR